MAPKLVAGRSLGWPSVPSKHGEQHSNSLARPGLEVDGCECEQAQWQ